jgi:hypothetical protein
MRRQGVGRPVRAGRVPLVSEAQGNPLNEGLGQGAALYREFYRFGPTRVVRLSHRRLMPPVVVELGELVGVIYRSDKGQPGQWRAYIHLMQDPPRLVSNVAGTQLYIVGGSYRVTARGIEG